MHVSTLPLDQLRLFCAHRHKCLAQAIVAFEVAHYPDGAIAYLEVAPGQQVEFARHMGVLVRFLHQHGHFKLVDVRTANKFSSFQMPLLLETFPTSQGKLQRFF